MKDIFLKLVFNTLKNYMNFIITYHLLEILALEIAEKPVANLNDRIDYVIHIKNLKQELNHGLILKKVHRVIKFNQKAWLKPYIDMNSKLRQKEKTSFGKYFFNLMKNAVFRKIWKK